MAERKLLVLEPFREVYIEKIRKTVGDDLEIKQLSANVQNDELAKELKDAEIVIGQPDLAFLQEPEKNCPALKFVQMTWAGTDVYTRNKLPFPAERIKLANGSGTYGMIMSQFVIGMTLSLMLRFMDYYSQQQNKLWERRGPIKSLEGAKVLIFGAGDIGTAVAKRLSGFDAYCVGVCRNTTKARSYFDELCTLSEAEKYLQEADVVVGCIPNSDETAGFMNRDRLSLMKKDSIIVNVGRGYFIDCMALNDLLTNRHLWGAALDVTNPEPLPAEHPLWSNPYCMITPHTTGTTFGHLDKTEDILCDIVCDNLRRYCCGEEITNRIFD